MTTIEEDMDEFFNFEDAAHHGADIDFTDFPSGPYDANLVFAEPQLDEDSFTCLQHFSASDEHEHLNLDLQMQDTTLMGPDDYTDFSRWLDGSSVPEEPCSYCRRMRIQCKVINEGLRKGSCTSCVALARSCSFTHEPARSQQKNNDQHRCAPVDFCLPGNTISSRSEASDTDLLDSPVDDARQACQQCEYCRSRGYKCKYMQENGRIGACKSCIALDRVCSLTPVDDEIGEWRLENPMYANNTWIPHNTPPLQSPVASSHSKSSPNLLSLLQSSEENMNFEASESSPKVGARFSRESVRILRGWLSTHHRHPYPTDEEKEGLQRQTGLNKTQITNWLANARRRGKVRAPRSTSPSVSNYSKAMDIPRRATPAQENMNPLEKWYHSPPENEPASVTAIAKAVKSSTWSSGRDSPSATSYGRSDDGSGRSLCNVSSTSSLGTSHSSGGSFASAFSHKSRGSFGSFGSFGNRGRRRRRRQAPKAVNVPKLGGPIRTYQCTFCTETFKTKHDWQRHEKSLHLSLERWICCPNGPNQFNGEYDQNQCVFCGLANPPSGHAEVHNYSSCADRSLEERTFYRKDHLRQHLNLVHDAKFQGFSMECWKAVTPEIRSRCGFCGVVMGSWTFRVDHLAEHFKGGKSMADWKGDWGFDPQVLDIVENGMPPYLIHDERNSMEPYEASKEISSDSRTLEDLVKIGLGEYIHDRILSGGVPTDEELLKEARHIVQKSDEFMTSPGDIEVSWFRDLILLSGNNDYTDGKGMPSPETSNSWAKKLEMINTSAPYTSTHLAVIKCQKERALKCFVDTKQALGLTPTDSELQIEACRILDETESTSNFKSKGGLSWFKFLATASTKWLHKFRRRTSLPRTSEMAVEHIRSTDDRSIDYSIHNQVRLENEMVEWLKLQRAVGVTPTDAEIQRTARLIVYKTDDPWNQTVMDDPAILLLFKRQQGLANGNEDGPEMPTLSEAIELGIPQPYSAPSPKTLHWDLEPSGLGLPSPNLGSSGRNSATGTGAVTPNFDQPLYTTTQNQPSANSNPVMPLKYFLNDANCYGRLVRELSRFVTTCTSANNPNRHIPTDAEIQNQARWIIYDDDDPWNQTAADNAEWLIRFKRDVSLSPSSTGPGLPHTSPTWTVSAGGSGFCPPYLSPGPSCSIPANDVPVRMEDKVYTIKATTAQKFVKGLGERYQRPASVFCSRELESGLNEFVVAERAKGLEPNDDALRAQAQVILGTEETAADDVLLLSKFKSMHNISPVSPTTQQHSEQQILAEFDVELSGMDFSTEGANFSAEEGLEFSGLGVEMEMDIPGGEITPGTTQVEDTQLAVGVAREYADLFRVQAATASTLGRRAAENAGAASVGGFNG